jgi:hypothetical protein
MRAKRVGDGSTGDTTAPPSSRRRPSHGLEPEAIFAAVLAAGRVPLVREGSARLPPLEEERSPPTQRIPAWNGERAVRGDDVPVPVPVPASTRYRVKPPVAHLGPFTAVRVERSRPSCGATARAQPAPPASVHPYREAPALEEHVRSHGIPTPWIEKAAVGVAIFAILFDFAVALALIL